jgi:hypothetical protein
MIENRERFPDDPTDCRDHPDFRVGHPQEHTRLAAAEFERDFYKARLDETKADLEDMLKYIDEANAMITAQGIPSIVGVPVGSKP